METGTTAIHDNMPLEEMPPNIRKIKDTITGMKIDIHKKKFVLANKTGGMSGPAIKPVAVRMVYQTAQAVQIPIIGMGGIGRRPFRHPPERYLH